MKTKDNRGGKFGKWLRENPLPDLKIEPKKIETLEEKALRWAAQEKKDKKDRRRT